MKFSNIVNPRRVEHLIYLSMWILVLLFPFTTESSHAAQGEDFVWDSVLEWWRGTVPYLCLFLLHNGVLIPHLFLKRRQKAYMISLAALLLVFWMGMFCFWDTHTYEPQYIFGFPTTLIMHLFLAVFVVGFNLLIVLLFMSQRDREMRDALECLRVSDELKYLKAQVNPHFFMNMLNNIHAMIEFDPVKAQDMVMELSKLMRYVLYEGDTQMTTLAKEVHFLSSYIALMRQRYPSDKVKIDFEVPDQPSEKTGIPPLVFIPFVENAFKHGISYLKESRISISISERSGRIIFLCSNTDHSTSRTEKGGVGLENIRRRLELLYGQDARISIINDDDVFTVELNIPCR